MFGTRYGPFGMEAYVVCYVTFVRIDVTDSLTIFIRCNGGFRPKILGMVFSHSQMALRCLCTQILSPLWTQIVSLCVACTGSKGASPFCPVLGPVWAMYRIWLGLLRDLSRARTGRPRLSAWACTNPAWGLYGIFDVFMGKARILELTGLALACTNSIVPIVARTNPAWDQSGLAILEAAHFMSYTLPVSTFFL